MAVANPVKGEVEVKTASAAFTFCYPWGVQKAITQKFGGKQFLPTIGGCMAALSDDDLEYLFGMGLRTAHPTLTDDQVGAILSEIGPGKALGVINESVAAAYDLAPGAAADPSPEAPARAPATSGSPTPASTSGSSSGSDPQTTSGA